VTYDQTTILVAAALLLAAFVKGTTGLGFPLIATPMVALLLDIRTAITILIIPNIVMDIALTFRGRFPVAIVRRFAGLLLLSVIGVFLGTKVLVTLPLWILNLCLGIMVIIFVALTVFHTDFEISPRAEGLLSSVVGFIGGFLNGMTNAAGPALAVYLYGLKLEKTDFVKAISIIFIVTKVSQLVAVSTWNLFNRSTLTLSLEVTVLVLLGFYVGLKVQDRINQQTFNRSLLLALFVIGVVLIVRSLREGLT
jgi:uncharacterized protein